MDYTEERQLEPLIISDLHELRDYVLPKMAEYFVIFAMQGDAKGMFWKLATIGILEQSEIKVIRRLKVCYVEKIHKVFCHLYKTR